MRSQSEMVNILLQCQQELKTKTEVLRRKVCVLLCLVTSVIMTTIYSLTIAQQIYSLSWSFLGSQSLMVYHSPFVRLSLKLLY